MTITTVASDELGNPHVRLSPGGWKSARFIIGVEMAERFAYFGVSSNLIMYLTGPLGESTAVAAANVNAWTGTLCFLPLVWAFLADAFLGRFRTIVISSSLYILVADAILWRRRFDAFGEEDLMRIIVVLRPIIRAFVVLVEYVRNRISVGSNLLLSIAYLW